MHSDILGSQEVIIWCKRCERRKTMNKLDYAEEVCKCINARGFETIINENSRNNASFVGITVKTSKYDKVAPVFNVSGLETKTPEEFADYILSFVPDEINVDAVSEIMRDREEFLSRSYYILVNRSLNEARQSLVRRPINQTLELQYKIDISDILHDARVSVEKSHINSLGITEQELYVRSHANTMEMYPYKLSKISDVIPIQFEGDIPMYVLTNTTNCYGAGAILYSGMREVLDETVGECFIIPSSVHEMIIIPNTLGEKETITTMIREINTTCVSPEDVLSDRLYELIADGVLFEV